MAQEESLSESEPLLVLVDADAGGFGRQLAGPHDRDRHTLGQTQPVVDHSEPVAGVLQRRISCASGLHLGTTTTLDLERVVEGDHVGVEDGRLRILGSVPQPRVRLTRRRQEFTEPRTSRTMPGPLLVDRLIPQVAAAMPLGHECALRGAGIGLAHAFHDLQRRDLARPFGPRIPKNSPSATVKDTPSTALRAPYDLRMSVTTTASVMGGP
jgi:hypothetical protein